MTAERLRAALDRLAGERASFSARLAVANALTPEAATALGLAPFRVAILRDMTVEPLVPLLRAELACSGLNAEVEVGDFDTIARDARLGGPIDRAPDLVLVFRWLEQTVPELAASFMQLEGGEVANLVAETQRRIATELTAIRARTRAPILIANFPLPTLTTLGILDAQIERGQRAAVADLNRGIRDAARSVPDVFVIDVDRLASRIGARTAFDERSWQTSRAPLGRSLLVDLSMDVARFARALTGRVRKCLVLDADDTLWGGIVGEDGIAGIQLDTAYPGSAYLAFQRELLNLRRRGVLLALVSKNNEADVLEVLRDHPRMLIREEHLAAWRINWRDKPANLREIADELNIGLDSLVLVDDSKFECDLVRRALPEVGVLQLTGDPSSYVSLLTEQGFFDSLSWTADDRARADQYTADRRRAAERAAATSLDDYLADLQMEATIAPPGPTEIGRVAQLTQKTNQFNLTTVRYTEGQIAQLVEDPAAEVLALRLRDRFTDLGLVGVAIVRYEGPRAAIDTLLMSCRVLGRGVEDAFLARIAGSASERGARVVAGEYRATAKNAQVASFYADHGFRAVDDNGDGSRWELELVDGAPSPPAWISIGGGGH